ncbi:MAG: CapA family protein [Candidatus Saccharibacteria bacterium]|nr:CapA family protein [Candidatus Saccharibacteria bacterium]
MIRISFVGDLMCSKEHINSIKKADATFDTIFSFANDKLTESDFLVGNLESPVAGKDAGITDHKWSFNSPIEFVQAIKKAGFNLVSLANNHCLDRGTDGVRATVQALNDIKLDNLGINLSQQSPKFKIYNIKDIKVGFLSYTYGTNYQVNQVKLNKNNKNLVNIFNHQERILKKMANWAKANK